jgi:plasmid stability protein
VAQLIVRNLDEDLVRRLRERAAGHGRSAEEEHRQILRAALRAGSLLDRLLDMPEVGDDADFSPERDQQRDVAL